MSNMRNRIIGTETEFGLIIPNSHSAYAERMYSELPKHITSVSGFLSNGARFYVDYNAQLEYASPECYGFTDAVHAEIAGESIAYTTLENLKARREFEDFHLFKRVIDDRSNTWGYHENYLVPREVYERNSLQAVMLGHLATRNIF